LKEYQRGEQRGGEIRKWPREVKNLRALLAGGPCRSESHGLKGGNASGTCVGRLFSRGEKKAKERKRTGIREGLGPVEKKKR